MQKCRRLLIFLCSSVIRTSDKVSVRIWMLLDFGRSRRHWVRLTSEWMSTAPPQLYQSPLSIVLLFLTLYQLSVVNYSSSYGCFPSPPPQTGSYVVSPPLPVNAILSWLPFIRMPVYLCVYPVAEEWADASFVLRYKCSQTGHFPVIHCLCFITRLAKSLIWNEFDWHELIFTWMDEWFLPKTRFHAEAKGNAEMVHYYVVAAKDGIQTES